MRETLFQLKAWLPITIALISRQFAEAGGPQFDLSKDKVLYCVGYAHLDTQWRWDFCTTIDKYIRDTLDSNFQRFEKYPGYVFNFTGSVRYEMMKEYYPDKYEHLKKHIAEGRWFVSGSSVDEGDVNVPSAEAIIRQVLYGNEFFRREFGRESLDFMLPDCFGFPASLPSIWAHCGLKGFSTQKLTWGSAVGIPFKIGVWEGLDGRSVIAALDPGPYVGAIEGRVDLNREWVARVNENGNRYGVFADYHYYGVGDQGGAPREEDIANYLASIDQPDSLIKVVLASSDQMYKDITDEQRAKLPRYRGDLLLTEHSAGTLTSQSYMKRWNRKNEILADAAERAAVAADWLGGAEYPRDKLYRSWVRLLANQMHDILPGTSIPRAYTFSWNDEIVAANGFAAVLEDSVGVVARALDTQVKGIPLVVYNPLAIDREDVVEATVVFKSETPLAVRVYDAAGKEVPSQVLAKSGGDVRLIFVARTPPVSWTVFDVRDAERSFSDRAAPKGALNQIENEYYRVTVNDEGDVSSIVDKANESRELLAAPARLVFTHERPQSWPAWNMDWYDRKRPPAGFVTGPAKVRLIERGPVRVALEIEREARNSIFRQRIQLSRGEAGRRVEFHNDIDWQSTAVALKASFPLTVPNPTATYNWGMGTIGRGNNEPTKYEVPSHEWFDLTAADGNYGVSVLEDSKFGSDKPTDSELRLTLLYTPGVRSTYLDQHSQDWGRHEMVYALAGHQGDWREGRSEWAGRALNQPLRAFQTAAHGGSLGRSFSLARVNTEQVDIRAIKLAEHSDMVILRLQELHGKAANDVEVTFPGPIIKAYEVDGQERRIGDGNVVDGKLRTSLTPFSPRSFALLLAPPSARLTVPISRTVSLDYDVDTVSRDAAASDGAMDSEGRTLPAEVLPARITSEGIEFLLGPSADGRANAVACRGQTVSLPPGEANRLYILAAADTDVATNFSLGDRSYPSVVQSWTGFVGQWDDRVWDQTFGEVDHVCKGRVKSITPGYIKRDTIAWFCTHRHHPSRGNEAYRFSYLFKYGFDLAPSDRTLQLPNDPRIKVFAVTVAKNDNDATRPAGALYDDFKDRKPIVMRHVYPPPPTPVFEGVASLGRVATERKAKFEELSGGVPVDTDFVDQKRGSGLVFRFFDPEGEYRPHARSGAVEDRLPRLNDGVVSRKDDDTERSVWFDNEGRFYVDLGRAATVKRINTFSWHKGNRAPQYFSVWGADGAALPGLDVRHGQTGPWKLLSVVDTRPLGEGGVHSSAIVPPDGAATLGAYRYLLWVVENVGQGTFFTEIDIDAAD